MPRNCGRLPTKEKNLAQTCDLFWLTGACQRLTSGFPNVLLSSVTCGSREFSFDCFFGRSDRVVTETFCFRQGDSNDRLSFWEIGFIGGGRCSFVSFLVFPSSLYLHTRCQAVNTTPRNEGGRDQVSPGASPCLCL